MRISRQEYLSGLPFPSPAGLLDPGIQPGSPALLADALPSEPPGKFQKKGPEAPGKRGTRLEHISFSVPLFWVNMVLITTSQVLLKF